MQVIDINAFMDDNDQQIQEGPRGKVREPEVAIATDVQNILAIDATSGINENVNVGESNTSS